MSALTESEAAPGVEEHLGKLWAPIGVGAITHSAQQIHVCPEKGLCWLDWEFGRECGLLPFVKFSTGISPRMHLDAAVQRGAEIITTLFPILAPIQSVCDLQPPPSSHSMPEITYKPLQNCCFFLTERLHLGAGKAACLSIPLSIHPSLSPPPPSPWQR